MPCYSCNRCGKCVEQTRALEKLCPFCGATLIDREKPCPQCGMILPPPAGVQIPATEGTSKKLQ